MPTALSIRLHILGAPRGLARLHGHRPLAALLSQIAPPRLVTAHPARIVAHQPVEATDHVLRGAARTCATPAPKSLRGDCSNSLRTLRQASFQRGIPRGARLTRGGESVPRQPRVSARHGTVATCVSLPASRHTGMHPHRAWRFARSGHARNGLFRSEPLHPHLQANRWSTAGRIHAAFAAPLQ